MNRANETNGDVRQRKFGHEGHPTWDIHHVHPDAAKSPEGVYGGVKRRSTIHVYLAEPDKGPYENGKSKPWGPVKVALYVPGHSVVTRTVKWLEELVLEVGYWGIASVVSLDDAPLVVLWELTPGKADG